MIIFQLWSFEAIYFSTPVDDLPFAVAEVWCIELENHSYQ